ncbi:TonB-dependent receptor domain-containing protein, partial [Citrobacter cronae]|uniref:TonB-dependent receptor domain-containing protein n=2 Tax=Gammaproteobacteria TaxID=1236 RepID=UPI0012455FF0
SELTDNYGYVYLSDSAARVGTSIPRYLLGTDSDANQFNGNLMLQYDAQFEHVDSSSLVGVEYLNSSTKESSVYNLVSSIDLANPVFTGVPATLTPYTAKKNDVSTKAVFLQQNLSFYDRFIVTGGVRNDSMDLTSKGYNLFSSPTTIDERDHFSATSYRGALTYIV